MPPPPKKVNRELTCSYNCEGNVGVKAEQGEDQGGGWCGRKCHRDREEYQGGRKHEDEEGGGGMCSGYGWEEEIPGLIRR